MMLKDDAVFRRNSAMRPRIAARHTPIRKLVNTTRSLQARLDL